MPSFRELENAAAQVRDALPRKKDRKPLHELVSSLETAVPTRQVSGVLRGENQEAIVPVVRMGRISAAQRKAERHQSVPSRCRTWIGAGARAFILDDSVLQGEGVPEGISGVHEHVAAPFLDSRVIVDEYQLYEARIAGFDAVVLYAALLPSGGVKRYLGVARDMDMECIVACASKKDVDAALRAGASMLGVFNGDAGAHDQNIAPSIMLKRFIPNNVITLGMDDNRTLNQVRQLREAGVDAVILHEQVLESREIKEFFIRLSKNAQ
ncbi:MAG: hypothetical protein NTV54_15990 [Ignavibacteriales bacterium]|nr:hypothetical protein [Ignavibacteriales bacterium]